MEQLKMTIADCTTGEVIERDMTEEEITRFATFQAESEARLLQEQAEIQAKAEAKASAEAKLAALGLTPEEIAAL